MMEDGYLHIRHFYESIKMARSDIRGIRKRTTHRIKLFGYQGVWRTLKDREFSPVTDAYFLDAS
jgi:hypothetical protein